MILDEAEALLDPVSDIDGFMLACLVDASTGMVLASRKDQDDISLPTAAAGAADIANVLALLAPAQAAEDRGLQLGGAFMPVAVHLTSRPPPSLAGELLPRSRGRDGRCRPSRLDHRGSLAAHAHQHHPPRLT